jgi:hypothetical protein
MKQIVLALLALSTTTILAGENIQTLSLRKPGGTDTLLQVALREVDGRYVAGVTVGPLGPTTVDCSGLTLADGRLTGTLKATIGFDGYYPKDGKPVTREYRLEAKISDGKISGTTVPDGTVTGTVTPSPDRGGYWVMDLQMENGAGAGILGPKSYGTRVYPKLYLKDSQFVQSLIYGWGGRVQINYFESAILTNTLRFDGQTLTGSLTVKTTGGERYDFAVDGLVVGPQISGTFQKRVNGQEHPGGPFHGTLQPHPAREPAGALHYLELHNAVPRTWTNEPFGVQLMVSAPCLAGKFGAGVAYAAAWNHVFHDVDAAGLKLDGTTLAGELKVTLNPDPYMPPDHQPVPASFTVKAQVVDGRLIRGTFTGQVKDRAMSGPILGELLDQPAVPEPVGIYLKLEDGVNDGAPWHRRTFINFTAVNGQAAQGGMSNNKGGWKGTFQNATVKFDGARFSATIAGTVDETKGPLRGAYRFQLTGRMVGAELVGSCDTYRDGKLTKTGTPFMGHFHAGQSTTAVRREEN